MRHTSKIPSTVWSVASRKFFLFSSFDDDVQIDHIRFLRIHAKPHRCSHLLAAVDSIELLTRRDELSILTPNNSMRSNISHVLDGAAIIPAETNDLTTIPTYLKPPAEQRPRLYARMTKSEWEALRNFEQPSTSTEQKCSRRSTVSFDGSPVVTSSRKSSILKNPLASEKKEIDQENDALHPIRMKCREVIGKMKVEEVLKMLCDDDDE